MGELSRNSQLRAAFILGFCKIDMATYVLARLPIEQRYRVSSFSLNKAVKFLHFDILSDTLLTAFVFFSE